MRNLDHPTITRRALGPVPTVSYRRALKNPKLMRLYKAQWRGCQRRIGAKLALVALAGVALVALMLSNAGFRANTPVALQVVFGAIPAVIGLFALVSIAAPMTLFALQHPQDRSDR